MNVYLKGAIFALVVAGLLFGLWLGFADRLPSQNKPQHFDVLAQMEKEGIIPFTLERLDGREFDSDGLKGKIVILNFWASWCDPCVAEFPSMIKLVEHFKGDVVMVAISADDEKKDIENFIKAFGLPKKNIEILWDKERSVGQQYGVMKIPETFIVGRDQRVLRKIAGSEDWYTPNVIGYFTQLVNPSGTSGTAAVTPPTRRTRQ